MAGHNSNIEGEGRCCAGTARMGGDIAVVGVCMDAAWTGAGEVQQRTATGAGCPDEGSH
jgi:hypothetical protein